MNLPEPFLADNALADQLKKISESLAPAMRLAKQLEDVTKPMRVADWLPDMTRIHGIGSALDDYPGMLLGELPTAFDSLRMTVADEASRMAGLSDTISKLKASSAWPDFKALESFAMPAALSSRAFTDTLAASAHVPALLSIADMAVPNLRLAGILKSFETSPHIASLLKSLEPDQHISGILKSLQAGATAREADRWAKWTENLKIPTLDLAASAAIARLWGPEGMRQQLELLDVEESAIDALLPSSETSGRSHIRREDLMTTQVGRISLSNWVAIISALFALWVWMESRDTDKKIDAIMNGVAQTDRRLAAMERLLESVLSQSRVPHESAQEFVVRSRVALIRRTGKHGSGVTAEALPNQTVELVSEDGKWIEVRYFDWNAHEERTGWALKKYFARVERPSRN